MKSVKLLSLALLAFFVSACSSSDSDPGEPFADSRPVVIQVLHASPDAPPVDILVDGAIAVPNLDFKQTSGQIELPAGTYNIAVSAQLPGDDAVVIGPVDLIFDGGETTTIVAANSVSAIEPIFIEQENDGASAGSAELFVLHAAAAVGSVDVYLTAPGAVLADSAPVGTFSYTGTLGPAIVAPGTYQVRVTPAGDPATVAYDSGELTLNADDRYVVSAVPSTVGDASPISLVLQSAAGAIDVVDTREVARVRVVHGAPDVPGVDVIANGGFPPPLVENLTYPNVTPVVEVPGDTYTIEVATTGTYPAGVAIGPAPIPFDAGKTTTVIATGTIAADNLGALAPNDDVRPIPLYAKLRVIHGAPSAPAVDVYLTAQGAGIDGATPALTDVPYLLNSGFLPVPGGDYDVTVTLAGTTDVAIGPAPISISDGGVYTAIARDPEMGMDDFGLIVIAEPIEEDD